MASAPLPLVPSEVAQLLAAAGAEIEAEVRAMPAELASWRPAEGEWCVNEVIGHIVEAERRGFAGRIR
ncbi:MAG TPA: DinB family protein [Chloroflexota bacterium]|nr:DinB family protein [Chloroflexota bacterium]